MCHVFKVLYERIWDHVKNAFMLILKIGLKLNFKNDVR